MGKLTRKSRIVVLLIAIIMVITCIGIILSINDDRLIAETSHEKLIKLCDEYAEDNKGHFDSNKRIEDYESYVDRRFGVGEHRNVKNFDTNVTDEWIMEFIPQALFDEKVVGFFYLGASYGFYFDYNASDNTYFIYLMLHRIDNPEIGQIVREIRPLYYERYVYNDKAKFPQLNYSRVSYEKYSETNQVYLKDACFTGHLFNANKENDGESNYSVNQDNGAFLVGGDYNFKGKSSKGSSDSFEAEKFRISMGYLSRNDGLFPGSALSVSSMSYAAGKFPSCTSHSFENILTNEKDYGYLTADISPRVQISNHQRLIKSYIAELKTPNNSKGLLFGINDNDYISNTVHFNYANHDYTWDSLFVGRVQVEIVTVGNGLTNSIKKIATAESNDTAYNIIGNNIQSIYNDSVVHINSLSETETLLEFVASHNSYYNLETIGSVKHNIRSNKGEVSTNSDKYNNVLRVKLRTGERFVFALQNISDQAGDFEIAVKEDIQKIALEEKQTLIIEPGEIIYIEFQRNILDPFTYRIEANNNIRCDLVNTGINGNRIFSIYDRSIVGSYYDNNTNLLRFKFYNNSQHTTTASLDISSVEKFYPNKRGKAVFYNDIIYQFNPDISDNYTILAASEKGLSITVYNKNMWQIAEGKEGFTTSVEEILEGNETYYIKMSNSTKVKNVVKYSILNSLNDVRFGNNVISNAKGEKLYHFNSAIRGYYSIEAAEADIRVFSKDNTEILPHNKYYAFDANTDYYFLLNRSAISTNNNLIVGIEYTDSLHGKLSTIGEKLIRYIPSISYSHSINASHPYKIYNECLVEVNRHDMVANREYFIDLSGSPLQEYVVSIDIDTVAFNTDVLQDVKTGYYHLDVKEEDYYTFMLYHNGGMSLSMYDPTQSHVYKEIVSGERMQLAPQKYYFYIKTQGITDVRIKAESAVESKNATITLGQRLTIDIVEDDVYNFEFQNTKARDTFRLSRYQVVDIGVNVNIVNKINGSEVSCEYIGDNLSGYWEFDLDYGIYVITLTKNVGDEFVNVLLELYIPNKLLEIKFNNITVNSTDMNIELEYGIVYDINIRDINIATHNIELVISNADGYTMKDNTIVFNDESVRSKIINIFVDGIMTDSIKIELT